MGEEIVSRLKARGERVLVLGRNYSPDVHGEGASVDLFYSESVRAAIAEIDQLCGAEAPKAFYWLAGYGWRGKFADQPDVQAMAEVNFAGAMPFVQWAWRKMLDGGRASSLVVVGSTSSVKPRPDEAVYVATKHAQAGLARALGMEASEGDYNVKVALFLPSRMRTRFWTGREPADFASFNDPIKVAEEIIRLVNEQDEPYLERRFPKGTMI